MDRALHHTLHYTPEIDRAKQHVYPGVNAGVAGGTGEPGGGEHPGAATPHRPRRASLSNLVNPSFLAEARASLFFGMPGFALDLRLIG
jgi:hypothetical protein